MEGRKGSDMSEQQKFRRGLRMKAETSEENSSVVEKSVDVKWSTHDTSPRDGLPLWFKKSEDEGDVVECYWRTTRQFRKGSWQEAGYWSIRGAAPMPINFEPLGWYRQTNGLGAQINVAEPETHDAA